MGQIFAGYETSLGLATCSGDRSRLNYLSVDERLPSVFMPVSPPPDINGGVEFLSWVIESTDPSFTPALCAEWLEGRLPRPIDDLEQWEIDQ